MPTVPASAPGPLAAENVSDSDEVSFMWLQQILSDGKFMMIQMIVEIMVTNMEHQP